MANLAAVLDRLNGRARRLFNEEARRAVLKERYISDRERRKMRYEKADASIGKRAEHLKKMLHDEINLRREMLFSGELKSFATRHFVFSARKDSARRKVVDEDAFVRLAKIIGIEDIVCDRIVTVVDKPNLDKFDEWALRYPEAAQEFTPVMSAPSPDRLGVKPNQEYLTEFDPDRLSGTYLSLEPKS